MHFYRIANPLEQPNFTFNGQNLASEACIFADIEKKLLVREGNGFNGPYGIYE